MKRSSSPRFHLLVILLLQLLFLNNAAHATEFQYNICNDLANQLLLHAASIATAIQKQKDVVLVPDHFIGDGKEFRRTEDIYPTPENSLMFGEVFDRETFQQKVSSMGNTTVEFVRFKSLEESKLIPCASLKVVADADPELVLKILQAFSPSAGLKNSLQEIRGYLKDQGRDPSEGVCIHHPDFEPTTEDFLPSIMERGLSTRKWAFFWGNHESQTSLHDSIQVENRDQMHLRNFEEKHQATEVAALIDFFICKDIKHFIGNSRSNLSAIQIAFRNSAESYWYNQDRKISLSDSWNIFQIPIVYTYTEMSKESGKYMLKASINSVRKYMPKNQIHLIYHGNQDQEFISWMKSMNVEIHWHHPEWKDKIEEMRRNGNSVSSNLFLHPGNYLGTWQRIDIPLFLNTEYCLLLDADTVVKKPFTLADFDQLTPGIAMSAEMDMDDTRPWNAGVMLMNIPHLKRTHKAFISYIMAHSDTAVFEHPAPSDQGAYLAFYGKTAVFLSKDFNFKPYWKTSVENYDNSYIIHFHGAKPHDYIGQIIGRKCDEAISFLCEDEANMAHLCGTLKQFAVSANIAEYCNSFLKTANEIDFCIATLEMLDGVNRDCSPFTKLLHGEKVSLPKRAVRKAKELAQNRFIRKLRIFRKAKFLIPLIVVLLLLCFFARKPFRKFLLTKSVDHTRKET